MPAIASAQPDSLWSRTYGGIRGDIIYCTRQTSDGGYISTGYFSRFWTQHDLISPDLWVLKTDSDGEVEWERLYGINGNESGYWIEQTPDGGYIVGGSVFLQGEGEQALAMKIDEIGEVEWQYIYNINPACSYCRCIKETSDGGYILVAEYITWLTEIVLIKLDSNGQEEWSRHYNGASTSWDDPRYVEQTTDNGYIVIGRFSDFYGDDSSMFLLKTDEFGEEEWLNFYGAGGWDTGECVHHLNGDGYIAIGTYDCAINGKDLWLLRTDEMGDTIWWRRFGGADEDKGFNVEVTDDNCFFAIGYTFSMGAGEEDVYAVKVDSNGQLLWEATFGGPERDIGYCGIQLDDNGYIVSGYTYSFAVGPSYDGWIVRLESDLGIEITDGFSPISITTSPSPFSSTLNMNLFLMANSTVSVKIFDTAGRLIDRVFQGQMQNGSNSLQWVPPESTPTGCYLIQFQTDSHSIISKCLLVR